jgi:CheY-like chemotaxis protein/two-component sensor histidine kinase
MLKEADRRKDEFLAMLAHELRNPLAPILNSVEVLRLLAPPDPQVRQARDVVERQVKHIVRLVDDLLDLSRITQGRVVLRKERLDLATVVAQAIQTSGPLIEARQHQLSVSLPTEPLPMFVDQARFVQVLVNLLNNAARYTNPGGQIWLTGAREDDQVVVRVKDTGLGVPPEMLGRIFDLFIQVDRSAERSQSGLGVGLTLVQRLVQLHGGSVSAHSAGLNQGSEFEVRLPLAGAEAPPVGPPQEQEGQREVSSRHVLIIEDNTDGRETLEMLLKLLGHRVEVAEDGPKGVDLALAARPEVALIDLGLPTLDGYEVAQRVRAALGDRIYLIALTGFGQAEDRRRTLEAGFNTHLVKPVDLEELTRLLAEPTHPPS